MGKKLTLLSKKSQVCAHHFKLKDIIIEKILNEGSIQHLVSN
jgi:hypothetical protein